MTVTSPERNKTLVLEAFNLLFNKREYASAERFWSERYIQHSAHIPPGRDGLFNLVRGLPPTLRYENHVILAEGDYVIAHGRFSGHGRPRSWIAADIGRGDICVTGDPNLATNCLLRGAQAMSPAGRLWAGDGGNEATIGAAANPQACLRALERAILAGRSVGRVALESRRGFSPTALTAVAAPSLARAARG